MGSFHEFTGGSKAGGGPAGVDGGISVGVVGILAGLVGGIAVVVSGFAGVHLMQIVKDLTAPIFSKVSHSRDAPTSLLLHHQPLLKCDIIKLTLSACCRATFSNSLALILSYLPV